MPAERRAGARSGRAAVAPAAPVGQGQVRIIGGALRRSVMPVAAVAGLRPTPDRVRETLFNWLGQSLPPLRVLDAFAGTGALGVEALSRGAAQVDFFETHPVARRQLRDTLQRLTSRLTGDGAQVSVSGDDVCGHLQRLCASAASFRYDLVFLDPPFQSDWLKKALPLVWPCMHATGRVYVEWHAPLSDDPLLMQQMAQVGWGIERAQRAGQVFYHLLAPGVPGA